MVETWMHELGAYSNGILPYCRNILSIEIPHISLNNVYSNPEEPPLVLPAQNQKLCAQYLRLHLHCNKKLKFICKSIHENSFQQTIKQSYYNIYVGRKSKLYTIATVRRESGEQAKSFFDFSFVFV